MTEDVLNWIKKEKLMTEGDTVIVGLSGGADSVALLLVLLELRQRIGYTLLAIHVEHGIRGEESRKDAAFVEELCRQKNIPCRICPVNVPDYAATEGIGVEEAARILRYECYQKAAEELKQSGAGRVSIALAHHANDNAETVLFQMARGSGVHIRIRCCNLILEPFFSFLCIHSLRIRHDQCHFPIFIHGCRIVI